MSYVSENLISGESVVFTGRLHWSMLLWPRLMAAISVLVAAAFMISKALGDYSLLAGVVLAVAGIIPMIKAMIARRSAEFAVTNKRVILKTGVVHQRTAEMFLNKIESVGVDQTAMGRMLGYGSIVLHGTGGSTEPFERVDNPLEFRRQIHEQIARILESR